MKKLIDSLVIFAVILAIWQGLYAYAGDVAISSPLRTFDFAGELLTHAPFWDHAAATLQAFAYALVCHMTMFLIVTVAGLAALWRMGLTLGELRGEASRP